MAASHIISGMDDTFQALLTASIEASLTAAVNNRTFLGLPTMRAVMAADTGLAQLMGALGIQRTFWDLGAASAAASAEGTDPTPITVTPVAATLTPSRKVHGRRIFDYAAHLTAGITSGNMAPSAVVALVNEAFAIWENTYAGLFKALAPSASTGYGTTGTPLTWRAFSDAVLDLVDAGASGAGVVAVLNLKGLRDLRDDALSLGGAVSMAPQIQQFLDLGRPGYVGRMLNVCDVVCLPGLATSGSDTIGMVFGAPGVHSKHEAVPLGLGAVGVLDAGMFTVEAKRAAGGLTDIQTVIHNAAGIAQQAGVRKLTFKTT